MRELGQGTRGRKYNNGFDGWVDLTNARINLTFSYPYIYIYIYFPKILTSLIMKSIFFSNLEPYGDSSKMT